ncbi:hypothetical protein AYK26_06320 [Euryarchaeota archaeon SM23-78]|nr:MAG: hypothetical protein AYK26_06320 [Euryarchaeota archaeon SM23-78]MBW3001050.1 hypothetical protein [Candidatus Woesearchaeota archaeon]
MSLKNNKTLLIVSSVIILLLFSVAFLFPSITDNIITGFATIAQLQVSATVIHANLEISNRTQIGLVGVNGSNVTIKMPVTYYGDATMNLSIDVPVGFECGFAWYINESGTVKNVTDNGTHLLWEADKSIKNTNLYFEVPPPSIISEVIALGASYYDKTIIIDSCCTFINVSVNTSVGTGYDTYVLYLVQNSVLIDKTTEYHLQVSNGTASFYGFNLSNVTFKIQGLSDTELLETEGGGSGIVFFPYKSKFRIEPTQINITKTGTGVFTEYITLVNQRTYKQEFMISSTHTFISDVISNIVLAGNDSQEIAVNMNTTPLEPGYYTDYIYVKTGDEEQNITINLKLFEKKDEIQEPRKQEKLPKEEQPKPSSLLEEKIEKKQALIYITYALIVIALVLGVIVLFLYLKKPPKDKYLEETNQEP